MSHESIPFDHETLAAAFDEVDAQATAHPSLNTIAEALYNSNNTKLHELAKRLVDLHPETSLEEDWEHARSVLRCIAAEMDPEHFT